VLYSKKPKKNPISTNVQKKNNSISKDSRKKKKVSEVALPSQVLKKPYQQKSVSSSKGSPRSEIYKSFDAIKKDQKSPLMKKVSIKKAVTKQ